MQTGRDSTGIKHEGKRTWLPSDFPFLSTTKMEEDPGPQSFRYWSWFGDRCEREIMCSGLKNILACSPTQGCPGAKAKLPPCWQAHLKISPFLVLALSLGTAGRLHPAAHELRAAPHWAEPSKNALVMLLGNPWWTKQTNLKSTRQWVKIINFIS